MTRTIRMVLATAALAAGIGTFGAVGANAAPAAAPAPASEPGDLVTLTGATVKRHSMYDGTPPNHPWWPHEGR